MRFFIFLIPLSLLSCAGLPMDPTPSSPSAYPTYLSHHFIIASTKRIAPPSNAPVENRTSGKYIKTWNLNRAKKIEGQDEGRKTGAYTPINGLAVQGFSAVNYFPAHQTAWFLSDNGAGNKQNSTDYLLYLIPFHFNFIHATLKQGPALFLSDPYKQCPFRIVQENTPSRYLTGGDFDPESMQWVGDTLWIGEEFGLFLLKFNRQGQLKKVFPIYLNDQALISPDHPQYISSPHPQVPSPFNIKRSKGIEGMAISNDKKKLYLLLEGPIFLPQANRFEQFKGHFFLRILEFDLVHERFTGRSWKYLLENNQNAIGDFTMINQDTGLVIERDDYGGGQNFSCTTHKAPCFKKPATFKRVYKIHLDKDNVNQFAIKEGYIDLLHIKDPHNKHKKPLDGKNFSFPFFTIEDIALIDPQHLLIANDNNYPFNANRFPNQQDDTEIIILDVGHFLIDSPIKDGEKK